MIGGPEGAQADGAVPLREHVEMLLRAEESRISMRFDAMDKALALSREELSRRLAELNQLRHEVLTDRSQFLPREIFDARERDTSTWRELTGKRLTTIETRLVTWASAFGIFVILLNLALRYFSR